MPTIQDIAPPDLEAVEPSTRIMRLEQADDEFDSLSSTTARRILATLIREPANAAAIASRLDTTIQNVRYHLEHLEGARLVTKVGTQYSDQGREMNVYRAMVDSLVFSIDGHPVMDDGPEDPPTAGS